MSFLEPVLLVGLPLVALPIVIHLLNRRRHRTVRWAAMMFLVDAQRMARGMARLRYLLIMAMRMLAIAGLIFAISRPLTTGWLGGAIGGRPDTTIILLDRSPSMEQQRLHTGDSKRSTGLAKLSELIETVGSSGRVVLIESTENRAREIESARMLTALPETGPSVTSADLPAMLEAALEYVVANQTGRTDIWILSDLRENDWQADDARWKAIRDGFASREGIGFYLLTYLEEADDNLAVRVTDVRRRQIGEKAELVLDIALRRAASSGKPVDVPLEVVINGARSVVRVEVSEKDSALHGHTIPLDVTTTQGWGYVELPSDSNPQDNVYYFVFAEPSERHTVIVSEDPRGTGEPLELAAVSPVDPSLSYSATVLDPNRTHEIDWDRTSLILWHAPLPDGALARQLEDFARRGRPIVFFPPERPRARELFGVRWGAWQQSKSDEEWIRVASWRGDSDLLKHTQSGMPLPLDKLRTFRHASIAAGGTALARFADGTPLLTRPTTDGGPVYFCTTLPRLADSSLAHDGVALYVMIQRALSIGAATQGNARQLAAGSQDARVVTKWRPLGDPAAARVSFARPFHGGAYQDEDQLIALNRPASEDMAPLLDGAEVDRLFGGLKVRRVEDQVGSEASLASEIWQAFLLAMAAALLVEAWLCLPQRRLRKKQREFSGTARPQHDTGAVAL